MSSMKGILPETLDLMYESGSKFPRELLLRYRLRRTLSRRFFEEENTEMAESYLLEAISYVERTGRGEDRV